MTAYIVGRKIGMTQIFNGAGNLVPVTLVKAEEGVITQIKTKEKDGYDAVQVGFEKAKKISLPLQGHLKKANAKSKILKEFRFGEPIEVKVGDKINISDFREKDLVEICGVSKGKGFAGVIKRHNFHRGPMSHGSHHHRSPGSIGSMFPQHVFKGKKLPGRMGQDQITIKNVSVVAVDPEKHVIALSAPVPGSYKSLVSIKLSSRKEEEQND